MPPKQATTIAVSEPKGRSFLQWVGKKPLDLVSGKYTLPAPRKEATVAVKLVDMLGENVLVIHEI